MATQRYWKLEKSGELGAAEVAAAVGAGGHIVLRTDVANDKADMAQMGLGVGSARPAQANTRSSTCLVGGSSVQLGAGVRRIE